MKAVKIRQVRQLLIIKLVQFHGGLTALNIAIREEFIAIREEFIAIREEFIAIREEFMLKKLSISIDFIIS